MKTLKEQINDLLEHEQIKQSHLMITGQFSELCTCNGRIEAYTLVKNLLKSNYNIDN